MSPSRSHKDRSINKPKCCWMSRQDKKAAQCQHSVDPFLQKPQSTQPLSPRMYHKGFSEECACFLYLQGRIPDRLVALLEVGQSETKFPQPGHQPALHRHYGVCDGQKASLESLGNRLRIITWCAFNSRCISQRNIILSHSTAALTWFILLAFLLRQLYWF